jgi:hypothetical protein
LALWREGLLAQKVLAGKTKGYRNHPQLDRFKAHPSPRKAIGRYLLEVWKEARLRGYAFDRSKIKNAMKSVSAIAVTRGQLAYEWKHLGRKLRKRDPARLKKMKSTQNFLAHPLMRKVSGGIAGWEKNSSIS